MSESVHIVDRPANFNAAVNSPLTTEIFSRASRRGNKLGGLLTQLLTQMHEFTIAASREAGRDDQGLAPFAARPSS